MRQADSKKTIQIVAGPNGSGKSTFAESFLFGRSKSQLFFNADVIASGLSPSNLDLAAFQAGRVMLSSIKLAINEEKSFAFESTLSGKTWVPLLQGAIAQGYQLEIFFLALHAPNENLKRIKGRVARGGHDVPKVTVLRRYPKSFQNFWKIYRPLAMSWFVFDNSQKKPVAIQSSKTWSKLSVEHQHVFEAKFLSGRINGKK